MQYPHFTQQFTSSIHITSVPKNNTEFEALSIITVWYWIDKSLYSAHNQWSDTNKPELFYTFGRHCTEGHFLWGTCQLATILVYNYPSLQLS